MDRTRMSYAEIDAILQLIGEELISKVPIDVKKFFYEEKDKEYIVNIDINKPLNEQKLQRETLALLTILKLRYWCENENEKKEIMELLIKNDKEEKQLMKEKCDFNELMKKNKNFASIEENVELVEVKEENFIMKFFYKIKSILKKSIVK